MADEREKPIDEVLAACRRADGGNRAAAGQPPPHDDGPAAKEEAARRADKAGSVPAAEDVASGIQTSAATGQRAVPPMPAKPAYAKPLPVRDTTERDRRGFLANCMSTFFGSYLAVGFTTLVVTNFLWLLGMARFMFPNILTEPPTRFKVGFPDDLTLGQVDTKFKAQFGVWVVRAEYNGQPQIYALQAVCTHLGCTPNWLEAEQKFKCPCHGSGFYKDGVNFEGPAPRPLERYAIRLANDGQLEVDKSRNFQEELGQWEDPASFVPV